MNPLDLLNHFGPAEVAVVGGVVFSALQSFLKKDHWSQELNMGISVCYSLLLGFVDAWAHHKLNLVNGFSSAIYVLGAAQAFFSTHRIIGKYENGSTPSSPDSTPVLSSDA